jgi:16S rRNA G966 N2-methylase RsmD
METFRGKRVIIPRTRDWALIDETDKYSGEQRKRCRTQTGKECTLYPFPVGMEVLKMFKPRRWLDPTAGWGDRLRCAIAYGCEYVGVDSNKEMKKAYEAIIKDKASDPSKYTLKIGKFQNARLNGKFDLVFTSPPFFTKEVYEHMVNWKSVEEFNNDFLKPLFKKSSKYLEKDGHLVLYIEDRDIDGFIEWMKLFVQTDLPELEYEGAFYYQGTSLRPYYVWLKK